MDEHYNPEAEDKLRQHDLLSLFEHLTLKQKIQKVLTGLKAPKESGHYKYARLQLMRLSAPIAAILVPMLAAGALVAFAKMSPPPPREVEVQIMEPEAIEDLEEIEELEDEPIEPPEPIDVEFTPDVTVQTDSPLPPQPMTEVSTQPAEFDAVAIVKSPVIMKGIFGSRNPGSRGAALNAYGGSGVTEGAVLRALRWLKKNQNPDGSWNKTKPAMTSLALLTFLAHGETPASDEFGPTVEKAIRWLVDNQNANGHFKGRDGHDYSQPICAYALSEAYALTKVPMVKQAAEKAVQTIVTGQNPSGGFDYNLKAESTRSDTSYMGWCAQALKAAKMAELEVTGLTQCMLKAIEGFRDNFGGGREAGGFGYTSPSTTHGLTGVGVLCMQLLGVPKSDEVKGGLATLDRATFNWDGSGFMNQNYFWYYTTQAKFHAGGSRWKQWNDLFAPVLVKNQTVIEDAIEGPNGELEDIGYWDMPRELSGHTDGDVMNTALCALQLQVYYRYLPTFKPPEEIKEEAVALESEDIEVNIIGI